MFTNLIDTLIIKLIGDIPKSTGPMNWVPVVSKIEPQIETHTIFLEIKSSEFLLPNQLSEEQEVISVIVAYAHDDISPWETKVPAKHMAEKLSEILGQKLPYRLSRKVSPFAGYYVCIQT